MRICIIGGGAQGHVCAAVLGADPRWEVSLLTGHPAAWQREITAIDPDGKCIVGFLAAISDRAEAVVPGQDLLLLCLPGFLIGDTLRRIAPLRGRAAVGSVVSSTGFFFEARRILPAGTPLFGFQRVPFISRVQEYGRSVRLLGYKDSLAVATENLADPAALAEALGEGLRTPVRLLDNVWQAALTNSNPILHTGRLYTLFRGRETAVFDHLPLFYKEWTDEASEVLLAMDREFFALLGALEVKGLPSLLDYYGCSDAPSLTRKISSIPAFQAISAPMKTVPGGWSADFGSRYFTEDFPYGLRFLRDLCRTHGIPAPTIERVFDWGMAQLGR